MRARSRQPLRLLLAAASAGTGETTGTQHAKQNPVQLSTATPNKVCLLVSTWACQSHCAALSRTLLPKRMRARHSRLARLVLPQSLRSPVTHPPSKRECEPGIPGWLVSKSCPAHGGCTLDLEKHYRDVAEVLHPAAPLQGKLVSSCHPSRSDLKFQRKRPLRVGSSRTTQVASLEQSRGN